MITQETAVKEEATSSETDRADETRDPSAAQWMALLARQQDLIARQLESLLSALESTLLPVRPRAPMSLRAELDAMMTALSDITAEDIARFAELAKSLFDGLKRSGVVGGGAVTGAS